MNKKISSILPYFIFLFFSVVGGSRMEYYSLGAWPAIALLLAAALAASERLGASAGSVPPVARVVPGVCD